MTSRKSRLAQATYRREVDSYRSTVADTAARIAAKMETRRWPRVWQGGTAEAYRRPK